MVTGKPFSISWIKEHIPAIVVQWYGGEKAGDAIADMLLGNINPSAKLPFSFPQSVGHLPVFIIICQRTKDSIVVLVDQMNLDVIMFFFHQLRCGLLGHGLSYTTFVVFECSLFCRVITSI